MATLKRIWLGLAWLGLFFSHSVTAESEHAPYHWKFVCHPTASDGGLLGDDFNAHIKANYSDKAFIETIAKYLGGHECLAFERWSEEEIKAALPPSFIKRLEQAFEFSSISMERVGFKPLGNMRPTGRPTPNSPPANLMFLGEKDKYLSATGCRYNQPNDLLATPIKVSNLAHKVVKEASEPALLLISTHEVGHLHQYSRYPYLTQEDYCGDGPHQWIGEATTDMVAIQLTNAKLGTDYHGPFADRNYQRFFLARPYYVPLNLQEGEDTNKYSEQERILGYRTNGLWDFIIRHYLNNKAGNLDSLYEGFTVAQLSDQTTYIDKWLNQQDGESSQGLEHVYPLFLTAMNNWPKYRFQRRISQKKWESVVFENCQQIHVSPDQSTSHSLKLDRYAGRCLEVHLEGFTEKSASEVSLHIGAMGNQNDIDELYLGWSSTYGTQNADGDCYTLLQKEGAKHAPCLLTPNQGRSSVFNGESSKKMGRYWSTDKLIFTGKPSIKFILTRVPTKHLDIGTERQEKAFNLQLGASYATLKNNGATKQASVGIGRMSADGGMHAPALMAGGNASLNDAFLGRLGMGGSGIANQQMHRFSQVTITESEQANSGSLLMTQQKPIEFGQTGSFKAQANYNSPNKSLFIIQNPKKDSRIQIKQYDHTIIALQGEANLCEAPMAKVKTAATMPVGQDVDVCKVGKERTITFETNLAFGAFALGNQALQEVRTPAYDAYKGLRLARIQERMGGLFNNPPNIPSNANDNTSMPNERDTATVDSGEKPAINTPTTSQCDCSCEGLKKIEAMDESDFDPSRMAEAMAMAQCAMTCMMEYAKCE